MVGSLGDFLKALKQLLETRTIQDKAAFYQLLCQEGNDFNAFYQSQQRYFIDAVSSFTEGMDEDSKKKLYLELPAGQLGADSTRYYNLVQERVGRYQQDKEKKELQALRIRKIGLIKIERRFSASLLMKNVAALSVSCPSLEIRMLLWNLCRKQRNI